MMDNNRPSYPAEQSPRPFWMLLIQDSNRTLDQALILAALVCLVSLMGVARDWLKAQFGASADRVTITLIFPSGMEQEQAEEVQAALEAREEAFAITPFGPDDARVRLEAAGVDLSTIDAFALQGQPSGIEFHWHGLARDLAGFTAQAQRLEAEYGVEIHWPLTELRQKQQANTELLALMKKLSHWGIGFLGGALALIATSLGRPRVGRTLSRGELVQVLVVRALAGSLLGWFVAGAVLHLTVGRIEGVTWVASWWVLVWVVPISVVLAPLGALRLEKHIDY